MFISPVKRNAGLLQHIQIFGWLSHDIVLRWVMLPNWANPITHDNTLIFKQLLDSSEHISITQKKKKKKICPTCVSIQFNITLIS